MPVSDGAIVRRGPEYQVSEFTNGFGPAPCNSCRKFHWPGQTTCGDKRDIEPEYKSGDYGALWKNPVWVTNQSYHRWNVV